MSPDPVFLYVEDEPMSRKVMELLMVRGLGYEHLTIFENSERFIQRLEALELRPTVIFLDIHMKPLSGFEMLHLLRQHSVFQQTRVIAVTASVMNEEVEMLREVGFDGAIAKPIDQTLFPGLLSRILQGE